MTDFDYSEHQVAATGDNSLSVLRDLARQQIDLELEVGVLEAQLEAKRAELRTIADQKIPELMEELGVENFDTSDGLRVAIKETVHASMGRTDAEKAEGLDWLEKNGHGALIKRTVEVPFSRGHDREALALAGKLESDGMRASFNRKVEPMTLKAFIVEELESGREIPMDIFKVVRQRSSRIQVRQ